MIDDRMYKNELEVSLRVMQATTIIEKPKKLMHVRIVSSNIWPTSIAFGSIRTAMYAAETTMATKVYIGKKNTSQDNL